MTTIIKYFLILLISIFSHFISAQEFSGSWTGTLKVQGMELPVIFDISESENGYISTLTSPKQSSQAIPVNETIINNSKVEFVIKAIGANYVGVLEDEKIVGTLNQAGMKMSLVLEKKVYLKEVLNRPQEPKAPFSYETEEVIFMNIRANNIKLAGTLTLPENRVNPPVAILITGSGGQNRNEEVFGHKPFLVIADHLTKNGIAVLRYDDRGVGKSEGSQENATSADFATDVEAAIQYLNTRGDIDKSKIGLIGHSEGGLIAPMVIAKLDTKVAFFISLAGTGVSGDQILISQSKLLGELTGEDKTAIDFNAKFQRKIFDIIQENTDQTQLTQTIETLIGEEMVNAPESVRKGYTPEIKKHLAKTFSSPWMVYLIKTNPQDYLEKITCPVLAINGEKDFQVIPTLNLPAIKNSLEKAGNTDYTIKELPGLNHLFQNCKTGALSEYGEIEETFAPVALELISSWINERF